MTGFWDVNLDDWFTLEFAALSSCNLPGDYIDLSPPYRVESSSWIRISLPFCDSLANELRIKRDMALRAISF